MPQKGSDAGELTGEGWATRRDRPPAVLFLQGNISGFFRVLGEAVAARGVKVLRINFNGGDAALWRLPGAFAFDGDERGWPAYLGEVLTAHQVTDIVLCGDCRPLHRRAILIARERGVRIHVVEEGYLRPGWITFERDGVNGYSRLPRRAEDVRAAAADLAAPAEQQVFRSRFGLRAWYVTVYHGARLMLGARYRRYRFHTAHDPALELAGWVRRLATRGREARAGRRLLAGLAPGAPVYLFPLQLDTDFQVRVHSPFAGMEAALEQVAASFAAAAPRDAVLLVKSHPLEGRLLSWRRVVARIARRHALQGRLLYIEHRDVYDLIRRARGVVTVNSTVGALALALGTPVVALGAAVYDLEGLTFQAGLDRFWTEARPPEATLFADFRKLLIHRCLSPGGFFSREAMRSAAAGALARLEAAWAEDEAGRSLD